MPPTLAHGKICYIELPAVDPAASAAFYSAVFNWSMRTRGDGAHAFNDSAGQVSGAFITGRDPATSAGVLVYIMVDDAAAACDLVEASGGTIVERVQPGAPEITARFRDPAGNLIGLYQERAQTSGS